MLKLFLRTWNQNHQRKGVSNHQSTLRSQHSMLTSSLHLHEFTNLVERKFESS
uniref:Uncharacterized protein n=1 Tax=Lotus japonicus TaxID=34305 RepID=I3T5P9_LOTJA|nr:unknown [Lotus japonicus]